MLVVSAETPRCVQAPGDGEGDAQMAGANGANGAKAEGVGEGAEEAPPAPVEDATLWHKVLSHSHSLTLSL